MRTLQIQLDLYPNPLAPVSYGTHNITGPLARFARDWLDPLHAYTLVGGSSYSREYKKCTLYKWPRCRSAPAAMSPWEPTVSPLFDASGVGVLRITGPPSISIEPYLLSRPRGLGFRKDCIRIGEGSSYS
jgi:hypothetical protein